MAWGLDLLGSWPQSSFKSETTDSGLGLEGSLAWHHGRMPVSFGLSLGYINLGEGGSSPLKTSPAKGLSPLLEVDRVKTSYDSLYSNLFLIVHRDFGLTEPYFEILAGYQKLDVETVIDFSNSGQARFIESIDHGSLNFGIGGGLSYFIYRDQPDIRKHSIQLRLGVRYTMAADYDFVDPDSIAWINDHYTYTLEQKSLGLFMIKAGLHFIF